MSLETDPTPQLEELDCPWCGEDLEDCECE